MVRWLGALLAAATLSWFALLLITGDYYNEGPTVVILSPVYQIGIHRGDVGVAAFWAAGMIGLLTAAMGQRGEGRRRRTREDGRTSDARKRVASSPS